MAKHKPERPRNGGQNLSRANTQLSSLMHKANLEPLIGSSAGCEWSQRGFRQQPIAPRRPGSEVLIANLGFRHFDPLCRRRSEESPEQPPFRAGGRFAKPQAVSGEIPDNLR